MKYMREDKNIEKMKEYIKSLFFTCVFLDNMAYNNQNCGGRLRTTPKRVGCV